MTTQKKYEEMFGWTSHQQKISKTKIRNFTPKFCLITVVLVLLYPYMHIVVQ